MVTAMGSKELSTSYGEALTSFVNSFDGWSDAQALISDFRGVIREQCSLVSVDQPGEGLGGWFP
jgi:hypothetical protein